MEPTLFKGTEESNYISLQMPLCFCSLPRLGLCFQFNFVSCHPIPAEHKQKCGFCWWPLRHLAKGRTPPALCRQSPTPPPGRKGLQTTCELMALMKGFFDQRNKSGGGKASAFRQRVLRLQTQHPSTRCTPITTPQAPIRQGCLV